VNGYNNKDTHILYMYTYTLNTVVLAKNWHPVNKTYGHWKLLHPPSRTKMVSTSFQFSYSLVHLDTLTIGHKFCSMLSILMNEHFRTKCNAKFKCQIMCVWSKFKTQQQQTKQHTLKCLPEPGIKPRSSRTAGALLMDLNTWIAVKLFNCFNVIGRHINKQSPICEPHLFNKAVFL